MVSIHQFVGKTIEGYEFNLPGISTGNFFNNFNDPEPEERKKLQTMIDDLKSLGIYAFMSNASHHAVIIYADDSNQQMTPQLLATRLQQDSSILTAISKAATGGKDMNQWKNAFINVFGSK